MPTVTLFIQCICWSSKRDIKQKLEKIIIRGILIPIIRFANFIVLLATSENDLQTACIIEMDDIILLIFKLNINTAKTKIIVYSKQIESNINNISLNGNRIAQGNQLKYLGGIIINVGR